MKLQCNACPKVIDTVKKDPVFTNLKTKLPHEPLHYFCSTGCQSNGEIKARASRPKIVALDGVECAI